MARFSIREEELNRRHQEIISRRAALTQQAKKLEKLEAAIHSLPSDEEAFERNELIRLKCAKQRQSSKHPSFDQDVDVKRHKNLLMAYENMVKRQLAAERRSPRSRTCPNNPGCRLRKDNKS